MVRGGFQKIILRWAKGRDSWQRKFCDWKSDREGQAGFWDGVAGCDGYDCAERITKKIVVPVVHEGKVEIWMKLLKAEQLKGVSSFP